MDQPNDSTSHPTPKRSRTGCWECRVTRVCSQRGRPTEVCRLNATSDTRHADGAKRSQPPVSGPSRPQRLSVNRTLEQSTAAILVVSERCDHRHRDVADGQKRCTGRNPESDSCDSCNSANLHCKWRDSTARNAPPRTDSNIASSDVSQPPSDAAECSQPVIDVRRAERSDIPPAPADVYDPEPHLYIPEPVQLPQSVESRAAPGPAPGMIADHEMARIKHLCELFFTTVHCESSSRSFLTT